MKQRCQNPKNSDFPAYGGRGITVCERWQTYDNFLADMGEVPPGLSLDRRDNDGNYEPNNCRWATRQEQAQNRRPCKKRAAAYSPEPSPAQAKLIEDLGGPKSVADAINKRLDMDLTGQAVSNWKTRGIPYRFRGLMVVMANEKPVATPDDFFGIKGP